MFLSPRVLSFKGEEQGEGAVTSVHLDHCLQGLNTGSSRNSTSSPKGPAPLCYSARPLSILLCGLPTEAEGTGFCLNCAMTAWPCHVAFEWMVTEYI